MPPLLLHVGSLHDVGGHSHPDKHLTHPAVGNQIARRPPSPGRTCAIFQVLHRVLLEAVGAQILHHLVHPNQEPTISLEKDSENLFF